MSEVSVNGGRGRRGEDKAPPRSAIVTRYPGRDICSNSNNNSQKNSQRIQLLGVFRFQKHSKSSLIVLLSVIYHLLHF